MSIEQIYNEQTYSNFQDKKTSKKQKDLEQAESAWSLMSRLRISKHSTSVAFQKLVERENINQLTSRSADLYLIQVCLSKKSANI